MIYNEVKIKGTADVLKQIERDLDGSSEFDFGQGICVFLILAGIIGLRLLSTGT